MTTTYIDAVDLMFAHLKSSVDNNYAILGYNPSIVWQGKEETEIDKSKFWARALQETVIEGQATFRNGDNGTRHEVSGILVLQLFCPKSTHNSYELGREFMGQIKNDFKRNIPTGEIWFRNSRIKELKAESQYWGFNMIVEYFYDEIV